MTVYLCIMTNVRSEVVSFEAFTIATQDAKFRDQMFALVIDLVERVENGGKLEDGEKILLIYWQIMAGITREKITKFSIQSLSMRTVILA